MTVGTPAPGRRVQLPWGHPDIDLTTFSEDSETILRRSLEWGATLDVVSFAACGDSACDAGEECDCPIDCGTPVAFEEAGLNCADGLDNDCDGASDCTDSDCFSDPSCFACGNGYCEPGEDCNSCSSDCLAVRTGVKAARHCCGDGTAQAPEGDGSICDGNY